MTHTAQHRTMRASLNIKLRRRIRQFFVLGAGVGCRGWEVVEHGTCACAVFNTILRKLLRLTTGESTSVFSLAFSKRSSNAGFAFADPPLIHKPYIARVISAASETCSPWLEFFHWQGLGEERNPQKIRRLQPPLRHHLLPSQKCDKIWILTFSE